MEILWLIALLVAVGVGAWVFATRQIRALGGTFRRGNAGRRSGAGFDTELTPSGAVVTSFAAAPLPEARPSKVLAVVRLLLLVMIVAGLTAGSIWLAGTLLTRALAGYVEQGTGVGPTGRPGFPSALEVTGEVSQLSHHGFVDVVVVANLSLQVHLSGKIL